MEPVQLWLALSSYRECGYDIKNVDVVLTLLALHGGAVSISVILNGIPLIVSCRELGGWLSLVLVVGSQKNLVGSQRRQDTSLDDPFDDLI